MKTWLRSIALAAAAMTMGSAASAELVSFDFSGTFTYGPQTGQNFSGRLTYDDTIIAYSSYTGLYSSTARYKNSFTLSN